jgi:hypothetical protein
LFTLELPPPAQPSQRAPLTDQKDPSVLGSLLLCKSKVLGRRTGKEGGRQSRTQTAGSRERGCANAKPALHRRDQREPRAQQAPRSRAPSGATRAERASPPAACSSLAPLVIWTRLRRCPPACSSRLARARTPATLRPNSPRGREEGKAGHGGPSWEEAQSRGPFTRNAAPNSTCSLGKAKLARESLDPPAACVQCIPDPPAASKLASGPGHLFISEVTTARPGRRQRGRSATRGGSCNSRGPSASAQGRPRSGRARRAAGPAPRQAQSGAGEPAAGLRRKKAGALLALPGTVPPCARRCPGFPVPLQVVTTLPGTRVPARAGGLW